MNKNFFSILGMLIIVLGVLVAAYFSTRYLTKIVHGTPHRKNRRIVILDQITVGKDQRILLVQVGLRYLLLSSGGQGISLLLELTDEEIELLQSQTEDISSGIGFYNIFMGARQEKKK